MKRPWASARATLAYFGLDTNLAGYSTPDYLLRSIKVTFMPFIWVALAALVLLDLHRLVVQRVLKMSAGNRAQVGRRIVTGAHMVAGALTATVIIGMLVPDQIGAPLGLALPLLLIASVVLLGYVVYVRSTYAEALATTRPSHPRAQALIIVTLGLLGALWAVGLYADRIGKRTATDIVADLPRRTVVVVYSVERIRIDIAARKTA